VLLLSPKFWCEFITNPKETLETLRRAKHRIAHPILKSIVFVRINLCGISAKPLHNARRRRSRSRSCFTLIRFWCAFR